MNIDEREAERLREEKHRAERIRQRKERMRKREEADRKKAVKEKKRAEKLQKKKQDKDIPIEGNSDFTSNSNQLGKRKRRKNGKIKLNRLILVILMVIAFFSVISFGFYKTYEFVSGHFQTTQTTGSEVQENTPKTSTQTIALEQKSLEKPIYILVVGKDNKSPAEADSLFLMAVNEQQKVIDVIGIPSNTKIESRDQKSVQKLNTIFTSGGIELTKAVVEDLLHIVIPYYAIVDEDNFQKFVNVVGTPSMYVEKSMYYEDSSTPKDTINLAQGYQQLDSAKALQYVRYVDADKDAFSRMQRQERFLKTVFTTEQDKFTLTKAWEVWRLWGSFDSNISTFDAVKLMFKLGGLSKDNLHYFILPGVKEEIENDILWGIDPNEAQRIIGITMGTESDENQVVTTDTSKASKKDTDQTDSKKNADSSKDNQTKKITEPGSE